MAKKEEAAIAKDVVYKPTVTLTDVDGEPEVGDEVTIKGTIKRVTHHEDGTECVVECDGMDYADEGDGLDGAMKKIEKKKAKMVADTDDDEE